MTLPRVLLLGETEFSDDRVIELLGGIAEVVRVELKDRADLFKGLRPGGRYAGAVGLWRHWRTIRIVESFDREMIDTLAAAGLKWIAGTAVGYDFIDVVACKEHGILYSNTPSSNFESTAATALYLMLSGTRLLAGAERALRDGHFDRKHPVPQARNLEGCTVAILGLGEVGLRFAECTRPFQMRVLYHNRQPRADAPEWCEYFSLERLDEMLAQADVLSVHLPQQKETIGYVGEKVIRALKKGAVLVNTARGKVVDEEAMIRALEDGHLKSIGLDVYPEEPMVNPRLLEFSSATLLPHMGAATYDSQRNVETRALVAARDFLMTGTSKDVVPELRDLPPVPVSRL